MLVAGKFPWVASGRVWVCLGLALSPGLGRAQMLTWDACVHLAEAHNPRLLSAAAGVGAAEAGVDVAASARRPQLATSAGGQRSGAGVDGEDWQREESYSVSLDVDQSLYSGGRTRASLDAAGADLRRARASGELTAVDVAASLRESFVGLLVAQEQRSLTARIAERRVGNEDLVRLRYESGREHRGSLALSEASRFAADVDVRQAERDARAARERLRLVMGAPPSVTVDSLAVTGSMEQVTAPPVADWLPLARATPGVAVARASVEAARAEVAAARGDRRPSVSAFGAVGRSGDDDAFEDDRWSAGLRLSYPFWSGGRESAALRRAEARRQQAGAELRDEEDRQVRTLVEVHTGLLNAMDAVTVQLRVSDATALRAEIARKQYESGLLTFESWDIIENDLIQSRKNLLQARRAALLAEAGWWRAVGQGPLRWAARAAGGGADAEFAEENVE